MRSHSRLIARDVAQREKSHKYIQSVPSLCKIAKTLVFNRCLQVEISRL